ncbi:ATP-binding protein [Halosimplex pelagicum]|uniref:ATP-binding protein n=1 Tax=Halosimplex pelagicum TaxID=869886 RepID=A0A7D5TCT5_9EURY|nr:ATP-binding protein [Halosimplex pelagicum]QLH82375.1 ATP-binding protein [Halosimplex pelagicum]
MSISEWLKGLLDEKVEREGHTSFDSAIRSLAYEAGEHRRDTQPTTTRSSTDVHPTDPFDTLGQIVGRFGGIGSKKNLKQKMDIHRLTGLYPDITTIAISPTGHFETFSEFDRVTEHNISNSGINPLTITQPANPVASNQEHIQTSVSQVVSHLRAFLINGEGAGNEEAQIGALQKAVFQLYELGGYTEEEASPQEEQPTLADLHETLDRLTDDPEESNTVREAASSLVKTLDEHKAGDVYRLLNKSGRLGIKENEMNLIQLSDITGSTHAQVVNSVAVLNAIREGQAISGPVLIVLDGAHYYFSQNPFREVLCQEFRHARHHNIAYDYNTQRLADVSREGESVIHETSVVEIHPPYRAEEEAGGEEMGLESSLSEEHWEFLDMPPGEAPVEYLQRTKETGWSICAYNPQGREKELLQQHFN